MRCLTIQLSPPGLSTEPNDSNRSDDWRQQIETQRLLNLLLESSKHVNRFPEIDLPDHNPCIQLHYFSEDLSLLWTDLRQQLLKSGELGDWVKSCAIIACEGEHGWDDMIVLFDYEDSETMTDL
ncbi:hypothetical protein NBRC116494_28630 [Aurantivibrio plasticivorans]